MSTFENFSMFLLVASFAAYGFLVFQKWKNKPQEENEKDNSRKQISGPVHLQSVIVLKTDACNSPIKEAEFMQFDGNEIISPEVEVEITEQPHQIAEQRQEDNTQVEELSAIEEDPEFIEYTIESGLSSDENSETDYAY